MRALMQLSILSISGLAAFGQGGQTAKGKEGDIPVTSSYSGVEMYRTWCASCHGTQGKGDGPAAAALKKRPADLTQIAKKNGGKFPMEKIRNYIDGTSGVAAHGSRDMPVWGDFFHRLGDNDEFTYDERSRAVRMRLREGERVVTLANYVESLQEK